MLIGLGVISVVLLTAATGWFVLQEFAYVSADRGRLRQAADDGDRAARRAVDLSRRLSFVLSGAQLGITATALMVGYVSEPLLGDGLADLLGVTGLSYGERLSLSIIATLVFSTIVQMVLGELAPKNWAIARPERVARAISRSTVAYLWLAGPIIRVFDGASNAMLRAMGIEPVDELPQGVSADEFAQIIESSREGGLVDQRLSDVLRHTLSFGKRTVSQVMTPRVDVHVLRGHEPVARAIDMLATGRARFPVVSDSIDDLIGVIGVAEVLTVPTAQRATTPLATVASPVVSLPDTLPLPAALDRLRTERRQLAAVIDEYGGFAGVVTFEDIAEQIVGDILDEDDPDEPRARNDGSGWLVPGSMSLDELTDTAGWVLPGDDGVTTVGGLVLARLGRVASAGDGVRVAAKAAAHLDASETSLHLRVRDVRRHVPVLVHIAEAAPAHEGDAP